MKDQSLAIGDTAVTGTVVSERSPVKDQNDSTHFRSLNNGIFTSRRSSLHLHICSPG